MGPALVLILLHAIHEQVLNLLKHGLQHRELVLIKAIDRPHCDPSLFGDLRYGDVLVPPFRKRCSAASCKATRLVSGSRVRFRGAI